MEYRGFEIMKQTQGDKFVALKKGTVLGPYEDAIEAKAGVDDCLSEAPKKEIK